jgi:hypothetical protein
MGADTAPNPFREPRMTPAKVADTASVDGGRSLTHVTRDGQAAPGGQLGPASTLDCPEWEE